MNTETGAASKPPLSVLVDRDCAESLADLLNLGFKLVESNDAGSFVSYTLEQK